jgi:polyvinyl alcohol dehydrogenase (cytochrome)
MRSKLSRRVLAAGVALATLGIVPVVAARAAVPPPCTGAMPAGDWSHYGSPAPGANRQDAEHTINPTNVASLQEVWTASSGYQSEPIVSGGCVFITNNGGVEAHDLGTGALVWRSTAVDATGSFAVAVANGRVHVNLPNGGQPKAAALDVSDGHLLWTSEAVSFGYTTNQLASAVVFDGIQVLFTTGPDGDPKARPGYALFDAATGATLYKATTIPVADLNNGYSGGGVWGTPTVDPVSHYLFAGTANPDSKTKEHAYDDAIIKLDLDRTRPTFGRVVASYKGSPDSVTGYDSPVCQTAGNTAWVNTGIYGGSPTCGQTDVDFGTGPTLWHDTNGNLMAAILQKSGVLHVINADTMTKAWDNQLGTDSILTATGGNLTRIATDGTTLYVAANPGILHALNATDGHEIWKAKLTFIPVVGGNVALANGVVYYYDNTGPRAWDAATGAALWPSTSNPTHNPPHPGDTSGSGIAVAGNRVVANCGGLICVYKLP